MPQQTLTEVVNISICKLTCSCQESQLESWEGCIQKLLGGELGIWKGAEVLVIKDFKGEGARIHECPPPPKYTPGGMKQYSSN